MEKRGIHIHNIKHLNTNSISEKVPKVKIVMQKTRYELKLNNQRGGGVLSEIQKSRYK